MGSIVSILANTARLGLVSSTRDAKQTSALYAIVGLFSLTGYVLLTTGAVLYFAEYYGILAALFVMSGAMFAAAFVVYLVIRKRAKERAHRAANVDLAMPIASAGLSAFVQNPNVLKYAGAAATAVALVRAVSSEDKE